MKFVELKKHLLNNNYYRCYNIFGDDSFLVDSSKNMIINYASNQNEFDRIVASFENFNADSLLSNLNSSSFFGGTKLVILGGVESQKSKEVCNLIDLYLKNPNPNSIFVVISDTSLFEEKKIAELNKTQNTFANIDCSRLDRDMIINWINNNLKQKNITMIIYGPKCSCIKFEN